MLVALVSICYWMKGNALRQEFEDQEKEESSLLGCGGGGEKEGDEAH